jgi:8-oxo-dGTP pyrophosphatase MutT (NUDIX family)
MEAERLIDFERHLRRQLEGPLPGPMVQRQLAPELAFGRHRGPSPHNVRQAAVLMLVYPAAAADPVAGPASEWIIPAIVRPEHMAFHPGQIALPGGMVEPGETARQAALREFEEELGVSSSDVQVLGELTPVYVFVTCALVTPFVALAPSRPDWNPNPGEVSQVIDIRLAELLSPACRGVHTIDRRGLSMRAPHYEVAGHRIWGATAMILAEFAAVCSAARLHLDPTVEA